MSAGIADIAASIRQARKDKGLTQRELGKRVGLPQSHISKIESGVVDLQLSSLVEIARALDLEVRLLPRKALPAIEGTVRAAVGNAGTSEISRAIARLQQETQLAERLKDSHPSLKGLEEYQSALKNIQTLQLNNQSIRALESALKPSRKLAKILEAHGGVEKLVKQLGTATSALQQWRNIQVHSPQIDGPRQRPAYRLEDDE